jgi:hypothetical protein
VSLQDRIDELEEEVRQLKAALGHNPDDARLLIIRRKFRLPPNPAAVILQLYDANYSLPAARLELARPINYGRDGFGRTVPVSVCKARKALGRDAIETMWGGAYRLTAVGRAMVDQALGAVNQAPDVGADRV